MKKEAERRKDAKRRCARKCQSLLTGKRRSTRATMQGFSAMINIVATKTTP